MDEEEEDLQSLDLEEQPLRPGLRPRRGASRKREGGLQSGSRAKRSRRERKRTEFYAPPKPSSHHSRRDRWEFRRHHGGSSKRKRLSGVGGDGNSTTENEWDDRDDRYFEARRSRSESNARSRIRPMNMNTGDADFGDRLRAAPKVFASRETRSASQSTQSPMLCNRTLMSSRCTSTSRSRLNTSAD